jgi:hypothetical protein
MLIICINFSDESALAVLRTIVSIPQRFLRNYGVTLADCESNIVDAYRDLIGTPRGCAILRYPAFPGIEISSRHGRIRSPYMSS